MTHIVNFIMINIMIKLHLPAARRPSPMSEAESAGDTGGSAPEDPPSTFRLSPDGVPMRKVPAPLARRFQQICVSMVGEALAASGIVQLEFAA
ncbi:MAG TPA: hypothetical protein VN681_15255, partial [Stellaceae bacterium]|nr:hypothetical protein [Stellaceae bacterium]